MRLEEKVMNRCQVTSSDHAVSFIENIVELHAVKYGVRSNSNSSMLYASATV